MKLTILNENISSLDFSRELQQTAILYRDVLAGKDASKEPDVEVSNLLSSIQTLGAKLLLPAIISAYEADPAEGQLRSLLRCLTSLYVRHNVIGSLENSRLETEAYSLAKDLRDKRDFAAASARIKVFAPSDTEFEQSFSTAQVSRQASARYVLKELELQKRRTRELTVETPAKVHVEHVYPRAPDAPKWPNHNNIINRLGNLTLLAAPINMSIKNKNFAAKKPELAKSDLVLTQEIAGRDQWSIDEINARQADLAKTALAIWRLD